MSLALRGQRGSDRLEGGHRHRNPSCRFPNGCSAHLGQLGHRTSNHEQRAAVDPGHSQAQVTTLVAVIIVTRKSDRRAPWRPSPANSPTPASPEPAMTSSARSRYWRDTAMYRRDFLKTVAAGGALATLGCPSLCGAGRLERVRDTYRVKLATRHTPARLWLPVPQDALDYQRVVDLSWRSQAAVSLQWEADRVRPSSPPPGSTQELRVRSRSPPRPDA